MSGTLKQVIDAQNSLYEICGFKVQNFIAENESAEYYAHSYSLEGKNVRFRIAKKTPTKTGWFVTMWKRNPDKIIAPYDSSDQVDLFVVNIIDQGKISQFVFPKSVLVEQNIFSRLSKGGKRAIRVYSPWDKTNNIQATKTKKWQIQYFVDITSKNSANIEKIKDLYTLIYLNR